MEQGFSIAWMGWQWDVPERPGPPAPAGADRDRAAAGRSRASCGRWSSSARGRTRRRSATRATCAYPPVDPDGPDSRLYVRDHRLDPPLLLPRKSWRFVGASKVALDGGLRAGPHLRGRLPQPRPARRPAAASPPRATSSASSRARPGAQNPLAGVTLARRPRHLAERPLPPPLPPPGLQRGRAGAARLRRRLRRGGRRRRAAPSTTASRRPRATATSTGTSTTRPTSSPSPTGPRRTPRPARRPGSSTVRSRAGRRRSSSTW